MGMRSLVLLLPALLAAGDEPGKPIALKANPGAATVLHRSQLLPPLEHAVGEAIVLGDRRIPARVTDKGALELDLHGDGKWKAFSKPGPVQVPLEAEGPKPGQKRKLAVTLALSRGEDKAWHYQNVTRLGFQIGADGVEVVDADGDGVWNEPGVDGMCWLGQEWVWPLPAKGDRWCTPGAEVSGFSCGPWGEDATATVRPLATTLPATLPLLRNINDERARIGLPPRPEDAALSAPLQKHCAYMKGQNNLAHEEDKAKPGYSPEGHEAGMNSILGQGTPPERLGTQMVATFYHRQDVIRPGTAGFGLGNDGAYSGIDGRRNLGAWKLQWPVLCPVPGQREVPLAFAPEMPDPINGDKEAGWPITVYFEKGAPKLVAASLKVKGQAAEVPCYRFDGAEGGKTDFNRFQHVVALIAKDRLAPGTTYEVAMDTGEWKLAWEFTTTGAAAKGKGR